MKISSARGAESHGFLRSEQNMNRAENGGILRCVRGFAVRCVTTPPSGLAAENCGSRSLARNFPHCQSLFSALRRSTAPAGGA